MIVSSPLGHQSALHANNHPNSFVRGLAPSYYPFSRLISSETASIRRILGSKFRIDEVFG